MDSGTLPRIDLRETTGTENDATAVKPRRFSTAAKDPTWEDMLIAYATIPGYVANRNIFRGTWYIESLCEVRPMTLVLESGE